MSKAKRIQESILVLALAASLAPAAFGQASYGNVIGTVTDPSGADIPAVKVTVTNVTTGVSATTATNASGNYEATNLLPGAYTLTFSKAGFQSSVQKNVTVVVGTSTPVNARLQVGAVTESVTVRAFRSMKLCDAQKSVATNCFGCGQKPR